MRSLWLAPVESGFLDHTILLRPLVSSLKTLDLTYHPDILEAMEAVEALEIWCGHSSFRRQPTVSRIQKLLDHDL